MTYTVKGTVEIPAEVSVISQANLNQSASQQVMSNLKFEKAEESKNANFISVKIQLKEDGSNAQQFYGEINRILSSQGYSDWDKLKHLEIINVFKFIPAKFAQEMATIGLLANRIEQILLKVQNANRGLCATQCNCRCRSTSC